jgi:predicted amidohydrolase YtcJ
MGGSFCLASTTRTCMCRSAAPISSESISRILKSQAEFRQRIADFAKTAPKGSWILNVLWDEQRWTPITLPNHQLIDDVTPDNPVAVARTDLHMILANAYAMKLAGVDRNTKDVPGGVIMRDADGNPTGIFKDAAKELIASVIPAETERTSKNISSQPRK